MYYLQVCSLIDHYEGLLMKPQCYQSRVIREQRLSYYYLLKKTLHHDLRLSSTFRLPNMPGQVYN